MQVLDSFFRSSRFLTAALLFFIPFFLQAENYVIYNEDIIDVRAVDKINEMGNELFSKNGVSVYVFAKKSLNDLPIKEHLTTFTNSLKQPYVLLLMVSEDKLIDIISSDDVSGKFNKAQILSPIPYYGTIRPLLVIKKDFDAFSAAILNGYADIVEQIAMNDNIKLDSAIGSANKEVLSFVRILVYSLFAAVLLIYIYKRIKYKYARKK